MKNYILKGCQRCGGDLARDWGDWICLQCGAYCYVGLYRAEGRPPLRPPALPATPAAPPDIPALPEVRLPYPGGDLPEVRLPPPGGDLPVRTERLTAAAAIPARLDAPACWAVSR